MEQFDFVIIGSGPAGVSAAFKARSLGLSVCLIEKAEIGGTCLNRGCIPTKAFLHGAKLLRDVREGEIYGLVSGPPVFDFSRLSGWKDTVVQNLRKNQSAALLKAGVRVETGEARVEEPGRVSIGGGAGKCVAARTILLAAGTVPAKLPIPGNSLNGVYTSDDILDGNGAFSRGSLFPNGPSAGVPPRLAIIGGGVIGVEFAAAYSAFGSEVTIIETLPSLLASMDREIGQNLALLFKKRGVKVMTGVRIDAVEEASSVLRLTFSAPPDGSAPPAIEADAVLMAAGRKPVANTLFAPGILPDLTEKGFIALDGNMMSSISGIYAAGDISGGAFCAGLQLAHAAEAQGNYAAACAAAFLNNTPAPPEKFRQTVPACVYTVPEISSAGLSLAEAEREGVPAIAGKGVFGANGKAALENMDRGFIKLVFHAEKRALIGAQFFCNRATELISWALSAIESGASAEHIAETVFPHPSYAETIAQAAKDALSRGGL
ncbi:MAG: NAD(P)/FAD-dependent oxidoreductase [Treponema sp.]|jgi:dihydrolipoamide dehydrogenase|nr:NAD(P)/FAD-dependent oxidoreductase [Treponema sp.]